ncbi:MAG TPA: hypothetical protein VH595_02215 [Verrucomicrobiae bacterium]|nr:hypothetical protein [Verrucomicrobiae bacterium]
MASEPVMTRAREVVLLLILVVAAVVAIVPTTRDEVAWWRAESQAHAADYAKYMERWPDGRHIAEARMKYGARQWVETKIAMINQAYHQAAHSNRAVDAEYTKEKLLREDSFFWKRATNVNTTNSYNDYVRHFPNGQFIRQARTRLDALNHSNAAPAQ